MIQFTNVSKSFALQQVIIDASFTIHDGERVGFVGPNGAGKSTLFDMLAGKITPDKGDCSFPGSRVLGYVRQQLNPRGVDASLIEYAENARPEVIAVQDEMVALEHRLDTLEEPELGRALRRLGDLQTEFEHAGGYEMKTRAEKILSGLGFPVQRFDDRFSTFSGGWQIRAELARNLVAQPDILLLDEPTNYLDVPAVEWLREYLRSYQGTLLLVSHDRFLLNSLTAVTIEVMGGHVTRYPGNYAQYIRDRESRHEQLIAQKRNVDRKKEHLERFIVRFKGKATKAAQAQSRQKQLDRLEDIEVRSITVKGPRIRLPHPPRSGQEVVRLEQACFSYDGIHPVFTDVDLRLERGDRAALVGLNGMGKTTLLRLIAGFLPLNAGRCVLGHGVEIGYQSQDYADTMDPQRTAYETAKANAADRTESEVRGLLGGFGFHGDEIEKRVQVLSGGEKVRLGLARLLLRPLNFLLLDEPTTHLDIYAREALEEALREYTGTICLVSHDIEFVKAVANTIFFVNDGKVTRYYGDYQYFREKQAQELEQARQLAAGNAPAPTPMPPPAAKLSPPAAKLSPPAAKLTPPAAKLTPPAAPVAPPSPPSGQRKQRKRDEARVRTEIGRLKRPHDEALAAAESAMEELDREQSDIYAALGAAQAGTDFAALNRRLGDIREAMDSATRQWEEAAEWIEKLESECEARLAELD